MFQEYETHIYSGMKNTENNIANWGQFHQLTWSEGNVYTWGDLSNQSFVSYIPYVWNGTQWVVYAPYIDIQ